MYLALSRARRLNHHKSLDGNRHLQAEVWIKGVFVLCHATTLNQAICRLNRAT